jgi:GDP-L-fucose synthase
MNFTDARIAITGGGGFLGTHLVTCIQQRGCHTILIPEYPEFDLTQEKDVIRMYKEMSPDIVIHLAAVVGGIGANMDSPGTFYYKNLMMGAMLIEHARLNELKKFVSIGTICAYPKFAPIPFKEDDLWNGYPEETNAPYGIAKKCMHVQLESYRQEFGFKGIFLLPVNLYGPRDNFNPRTSHVIPAIIKKCCDARDAGEKEIICWGTGTATREFLYVEDAAKGIALATEKYDEILPVNLGAGFEISIRDLVELIAEKTGFKGNILWDKTKPDGQPRRSLDVTRAKEKFGFTADTPFDKGIEKTIEWYETTRDKS